MYIYTMYTNDLNFSNFSLYQENQILHISHNEGSTLTLSKKIEEKLLTRSAVIDVNPCFAKQHIGW